MHLSNRYVFLATVFLILSHAYSTAAQSAKVVLTGNMADLRDPREIFPLIEKYCSTEQNPVLWVLNGDNFRGPDNIEGLQIWKAKAGEILDRFPNLNILIAQGDRDWDDSRKKGWKKVRALEKTLIEGKHDRLHVFINQGCPGPWSYEFTSEVNIVMLNSQWWNHPHEKPLPGSDACEIADTDIFVEELEGILDESTDKNVLLLTHFPLASLGTKGGRFPISTYLLPPVVGSAVAGFHQNVGGNRDINNERFSEIRYRLEGMLQNYASIIVGSAHENNHSVLKAGQNYYINSGALGKGEYVANSNRTMLTSSGRGFIEIAYFKTGEVRYQFFRTENQELKMKQAGTLLYSACADQSLKPKNTSLNPCDNKIPSSTAKRDVPKTKEVVAGAGYASSKFKQRWLGKHYRTSWTTPVNVPYLNMDTTAGGLTVTGKGGGRQTTSLKLEGKNGKEYVFRSIDKDPSKALPFELRGTVVSDVLKDQTTTQQPYGALAVAYWLDKVNILHATPTLYVLPDHPALGQFRDSYKDLFGMLEERPTDKVDKDKVFGGAKDIEKSFKLFEKMFHSHNNTVAENEFVRARVFDIWVGDWSKHEDNWKWAGFKTTDGEEFRPVPRDRDHAFSRWDGIIPWLADREWAMPNGENFDTDVKGLRSLVWQARHLDRFVANEATRKAWLDAAKEIQNTITDHDIEAGVRSMPKEIYEPDGKEIEAKLKARLRKLDVYAARYYDLLAEEVDVVGSNKDEHFAVVRNMDGSVKVSVFDLDKDDKPDTSKIIYRRLFLPQETKEIRLFGLQGGDTFDIKGSAPSSILIRVISGDGNDAITDNSVVVKGLPRTLIYEKEKETPVVMGSETRRIKPKDPALYQYDRHAFKYNTYLPIALIGYSPFTGFLVQGGVSFTRQKFGKPEFSSKHQIKASVSTLGNYDLNYNNQFRYLIGRWDGVSSITISRPLNYNYFFGVGNDTPKESDRSKNYYRAQYNMTSVSAGLKRLFLEQSSLEITASYEFDEGVKKSDSYLNDHDDILGVGKLHLMFLNGALDLDFRDRPALAEHGFRFYALQNTGHVSGVNGSVASITEGKIENYFSTYWRNPITLGIQLGAGTTHGELPFYKLFSLGQMNNLHGFKRNRFTGESKAYLNSELRFQITQTNNTFIPLKIGVRGFYDVGRVWADNDTASADYWHYGYGGGFYITPFREQFAFNISAGSSKEESLLLMFSVGSFLR